MNKIVASVGLVALSASGLKAALPAFDEGTKPWSASVTLRGFYDDNRNTAPSSFPGHTDSWGFEVSPSLAIVLPWEATTLSASYVYSYKWYDRPVSEGAGHADQTHLLNVAVDHKFSERYGLNARDSFVVGQEPDVLRTGNAFTTFQRISGNNIRNEGNINFRAQITPLVGAEIGYDNEYFDYEDAGGFADEPSFSGLLDRVEHRVHLDSRWNVLPETVAIAGYQYRQVGYTADEPIGVVLRDAVPTVIFSEDRNFREHYGYVGAEQIFNPQLTASVRAGIRYIEFYNDPSGNGNGWGPYAMGNVRWTYHPDSYVEIGLSHDMNATDVVGAGVSDATATRSFTASQESTSVYGSINHRITPKLRGSIVGQFQHSEFNGGTLDGLAENYYLVGLNLNYAFTRHFSAEFGYNYDNLDSDATGRTFDRNRVYIGITGSY